jgi:hypothetical protein
MRGFPCDVFHAAPGLETLDHQRDAHGGV